MNPKGLGNCGWWAPDNQCVSCGADMPGGDQICKVRQMTAAAKNVVLKNTIARLLNEITENNKLSNKMLNLAMQVATMVMDK